jgi:hypothetical protein
MAWVRWRGQSAQLLATIWEQGTSHQRVLANFQGAYSVSWSLREAVTRNFPHVSVDWSAVADALAQGPPQAPPLTATQWDWARVEQQLQDWGHQSWGEPDERERLLSAAAVLASWRARQTPPSSASSSTLI